MGMIQNHSPPGFTATVAFRGKHSCGIGSSTNPIRVMQNSSGRSVLFGNAHSCNFFYLHIHKDTAFLGSCRYALLELQSAWTHAKQLAKENIRPFILGRLSTIDQPCPGVANKQFQGDPVGGMTNSFKLFPASHSKG